MVTASLLPRWAKLDGAGSAQSRRASGLPELLQDQMVLARVAGFLPLSGDDFTKIASSPLQARAVPTMVRPLEGIMGRRQAVRQWILIPPCGGSNPPAPATSLRLPDLSRHMMSVRCKPLRLWLWQALSYSFSY